MAGKPRDNSERQRYLAYRQKTGYDYETACCRYLEDKGYEILERNFRTRYGEIDIIARDGDAIVFAEVKYRSEGGLHNALEAVDKKKQRQIIKMARIWLLKNSLTDSMCRFDVCACAGGRMAHIENAFEA